MVRRKLFPHTELELVEALEEDKSKAEIPLTDAMRDVLREMAPHGRAISWRAGKQWPTYRGLETRGLVRRGEDQDDGEPTYHLTPSGQRLANRLTLRRVDISERLFETDAPAIVSERFFEVTDDDEE